MTVDQVREHAKSMELESAAYLDKYGNMGAYGRNIRHVRICFIDGKCATLTSQEFSTLHDVTFMLRPARDHA